MNGLRIDTRFTIILGPFSGAGPTYTGQVSNVGSSGYTVDDIVVGDELYDGKAIYNVDAISIDTAGSIATLTVTYVSGDTPDTAPNASRGQITHRTPNLDLSLVTYVGSSAITPEQLAVILTSNFIKIDEAIGLGGGGGGTVSGGAFINTVTTGTNTVVSFDSTGIPAGSMLISDGAGGFIVLPALTLDPASDPALTYNPTTNVLSLTSQPFTSAPQADLAAFIAAQYTAGNEFQAGDHIQTADGNIYIHNGGTAGDATDFTLVNGSNSGLLSSIPADTTGNLLSNQPYVGEERLFVWSTDEQVYYVVDDSGNLSPVGSATTADTLYETPAPVNGAVITIPGLLPTSDIKDMYMDNTFLYPSEYTVQAGQITLLGDPADDSNFFARFN